MPVKIRLMRIGATKRPFYRVVAVDERKKRTGSYLELLGTYNPLTTPKEIILKQDRIDEWLKKGAQPSDGFLRIIGKAPQRVARKPKKAKKEPAEAAKPAEPAKSEETPAAEITETAEPSNAVEESAPVESPIEEETSNTPPEATEASDSTETPSEPSESEKSE